MPARVDFSGVFDNALPNVYIQKVSLLDSSAVESKAGVYFDQDALYEFETTQFGKKKAAGSSIDFSKIPNDSRNLMVKVDMTIKDRMLSDKTSQWFGDERSNDFLKIRVILCRDPSITRDLLRGRFTNKYLEKLRDKGVFLEKIIDAKKDFDAALEEKDYKRETIRGRRVYSVPYTATFNIPNYNPKHLSVFAVTYANMTEVALARKTFFKAKQELIQGNVAAEIIIKGGKSLSKAAIYKKSDNTIWAGPVHYHKEKGYMAGAFHTANSHPTLSRREMANFVIEDYRELDELGRSKSALRPESFKDTREKNQPSSRSRNAEDNKQIRDEQFITEPLYSTDRKNRVRFSFFVDFEKIVRKKTQYGHLMNVADSQAKAEIMDRCRIRNLRIFRDRVKGGLRQGEIKLVEYDDRTEMVAMSSETAAGQLPRRIIYSNPDDPTSEADSVIIGAIREENISGTKGIRTFSVTDFDMGRRTDGKYRYRVSMEIEDGTVGFMKDQMSQLQGAKSELIRFYSTAEQRGNYDAKNEQFTEKFINLMKSTYEVPGLDDILSLGKVDRAKLVQGSIADSPWVRAISVYLDVLYNSTNIKADKILRVARMLHRLANPSTGTLDGIRLLLEEVEKLEDKLKRKLGRQHVSMDEMDRGSRTSVFKAKMEKSSVVVEKEFEQFHDSNVPNDAGYDYLGGKTRNRIGLRKVSLEDYKTRVDLEQAKYFSSAQTDLTNEDTEIRGMTSELLDLNSRRPSYLGPAIIRAGRGQQLNLLSRRQNAFFRPQQYQRIAANILAMNPDRSSQNLSLMDKSNPLQSTHSLVPAPPFSKAYNKDITELEPEIVELNLSSTFLLGDLNISLLDVEQYNTTLSFKNIIEEKEEEEQTGLDPKNLLGENNKFSTDALEKESLTIAAALESQINTTATAAAFLSPIIKNSGVSIYEEKGRVQSISDLNLSSDNNVVEKLFSKTNNPEKRIKAFYSVMPNQLKSIFLGRRPIVKKDWFATKINQGRDLISNPEQSAMFYFAYQKIVRVEMFTGFQKANKSGEACVAKPEFKLLTREMVERIAKNNHTVLCRLMPYSNNMLGLGHNPKFSMPTFDRHFILGPRKSVNDLQPDDPTDTESTNTTEATGIGAAETLATKRLSEYGAYNETGTRVMRALLRDSIQQEEISPEYMVTTLVQQPRRTTRLGTNFDAVRPVEPALGPGSLVQRATGVIGVSQVSGMTPVTTSTTTSGNSAPTTGNGGSTSSGGTTGGGTTGGGTTGGGSTGGGGY